MNEESCRTVARRVIYHGRVQGVGFRATARQIAQNHAVAGFVRNLADGTVELVAQGDANEVNRFLAAVSSRMSALIERTESANLPQDTTLKGFTIRLS